MFRRRPGLIDKLLETAEGEAVGKLLDELSRSRKPQALSILFKRSSDESFSGRKLAAAGFASSVSARPKPAIRHPNRHLRRAAVMLLGQSKVLAAIPEISRVLRKDPDLLMRHLSAEALGEIGHASCIPVLIQASTDSSSEVRASALRGLQKVKSVPAERAVIRFLSDSDWKLRLDTKEHLERTGWIPETPGEKALWGIALGRFDEAVAHGQDSVDALVDATLHVNDAEVRRWSAVALTRMNSSWAIDRLQRAAQSPDSLTGKAAADALTILGVAIESEGQSWHGESEELSPAALRESIFASAARFMAVLGHC